MKRSKPDYTLLNHTADLGIRVRGSDLISLFEGAGKALLHLMVTIKSSGNLSPVKISLSGSDLEDLMVRWLGEILFLLQGEKLVVTSIKIRFLSPYHLEATLKAAPFDPRTHEILNEIKAVTYHRIEVVKRGDSWEATVIFDL